MVDVCSLQCVHFGWDKWALILSMGYHTWPHVMSRHLHFFIFNDILWVKLLSFYFMATIIRILIKIMFYDYIL